MSLSVNTTLQAQLSSGFAESGYPQQTFLGASIRSFTMNGGFNDSSSELSVDLVNDEYNVSDGRGKGLGDDVYHDGIKDTFSPPMVGSPVFFKFGHTLATIAEAYTQTFNDTYNTTAVPSRGKDHVVFGGILQSFVQNRSMAGNPLYSVKVVDPREILSNVTLVLNNYAGTTFDKYNLYNIYGFLEFNAPLADTMRLGSTYQASGELSKSVNGEGETTFVNLSLSDHLTPLSNDVQLDAYWKPNPATSSTDLPQSFPLTGTGYSRRGSQGIPYYRVAQAFRTMLRYDGAIPDGYAAAGFGAFINFRGYNYVVDFSGLPNLPPLYYLDFDQINLLDICLEICEVLSRDLFVSLLPIIDHSSCSFCYNWNQNEGQSDTSKLIAGIIRIDTIDRSQTPSYGVIKSFIDSARMNATVKNQDVGYELSNTTTDKFIVGAQEVDMYFFSGRSDRDTIPALMNDEPVLAYLKEEQWRLKNSLRQQILPYYGKLGIAGAVTIPKGFGPYQQILLDTTGLNANGVGNYYVATEMEIRCAMMSFDRWKAFLLSYNDVYLESTESGDAEEKFLASVSPVDGLLHDPTISNNYGVTVPRSVFPSDDDYTPFGADTYPKSPCNPPYGYPLYYKRATKLGLPEAGLTDISTKYTTIVTNLASLKAATDPDQISMLLNSVWTSFFSDRDPFAPETPLEIAVRDYIKGKLNANLLGDLIGLLENHLQSVNKTMLSLPRLAKKGTENAMRVYEFLKQIGDECLGKKFLIRIPKYANIWYHPVINSNNPATDPFTQGPFGFRPIPISNLVGYQYSYLFKQALNYAQNAITYPTDHMAIFLDHGPTVNLNGVTTPHYNHNQLIGFQGGLRLNMNPMTNLYEFNYMPEPQGGFFDFDLLTNASNQHLGITQMLVPSDLTNFINGGRVSAYVRFDHSENLALDSFRADSFIQQTITSAGMIPDFCEQLSNVDSTNNNFNSFKDVTQTSAPFVPVTPQVVFIKCSLDESFYMPPRHKKRLVPVNGDQVKDIGKFSVPRQWKDPDTKKMETSVSYYLGQWVPNPIGAGSRVVEIDDFIRRRDSSRGQSRSMTGLSSDLGVIDAPLDEMDVDHVYALITLPDRVVPTVDARFRDALFQDANANSVQHFLTIDTVRIPEFRSPAIVGPPVTFGAGINNPKGRQNAKLAYDTALAGMSFANPQQLNLTMPSPVYPDLVAIPLMSKERCYGPWVSSQVDSQVSSYGNMGGRIEFSKDENLSPWNYAGYAGMNNAGILNAEFSNGLLLFTERGGFTVGAGPSGASLCKALLNVGPLVTNIDVKIDAGSIHTTYQLDLYTASFGKLQKQRSDEISKIGREKQRVRDEKNALVRKGLGKSQMRTNYQAIHDKIKAGMNPLTGGITNTIQTPAHSVPAAIVSTVKPVGSSGVAVGMTTLVGVEMTYQSADDIASAAQSMPSALHAAASYYNSAGGPLNSNQAPASMDNFHPNMSYQQANHQKSKLDLYNLDSIDNQTITIYEA